MVAGIAAFAFGALIVWATVLSAVRTIVLPHGGPSRLNRTVFAAVRRTLDLRASLSLRRDRQHRHHEIGSLYAPLALVSLPMIWLTIALAGFTAMFWGLGTRPLANAFKLAGSSMLTLGFFNVDDLPRLATSFFAAALTISLLALLLVTYLPTMYQAYSERETAIAALETFAGEPPDPTVLLIRHHQIGGTDQLLELWQEWRTIFFGLRESHTANPAVTLFRSSTPDRHWVRAVETVLDAASLWNAACRNEQDPNASLCIRAGSLAMADVAAYFRLPTPDDPQPDDPISVDRANFTRAYERLREAGIDTPADEETAWRRWRGWRVNYDLSVTGLAELTGAPPRS